LELHPKLIDLSLDRVEALLGRLGDPHTKLPPVIHVAGTNGKGSVIAFLRAMLEAAGYRVHVYVSPHLMRFNERIRVAGELIAEDALSAVLEECEAANKGELITFFEITTAAAFLAFTRTPADLVLLETGLGGRLDATNLVARPALTVITPVSMDHQHFLGETLAEIAGEKAGILKPGVTCVVATQKPAAAGVIAETAGRVGAPLVRQGVDWTIRGSEDALLYQAGARTRVLSPPGLNGGHQFQNAGLALACVDHLDDFAVAEDAIARGLATAEWPGRLQRLDQGPLVTMLPEGWELWVDGGHNADAASALAEEARNWHARPLNLIVGMMENKDPEGFLTPLAPYTRRLRAVAIPGEKGSQSAERIAAAGEALDLDAKAAKSVTMALADIIQSGVGPSRVLICGSLYLVGTVLRDHE
jgi:dihydrofolate synthase/folylpolyglutamate synthase